MHASQRKHDLARREFLIRSSAALAAGSCIAGMNSSQLWAAPASVTARETARGFLESLSPTQRPIAQIEYSDARRTAWHFIPMETRKGLPLREMNEAQRTAAMGLLAAILSEEGFRRAVDIMAYEAILLELEGPAQAKRRDYQKFYFTVYGNPSEKEFWGVSVEGHHLSVNITYEGDRIVDSTPQFFGVNPARLKRDFKTPDPLRADGKSEYRAGTRLLLPEEQAAYELLGSLSDEQTKQAVFQSDCPDDIQWPGEPQPHRIEPVGIVSADLNADQQKKFAAILTAYFSTMPESVAKDRWQNLIGAGLGKIRFGWAGGRDPSEQHFFRVQGPTFIAELCNFQTDPEGNKANHIHSVWRDLTGDFHLPLEG
jgi:hypothetical protein